VILISQLLQAAQENLVRFTIQLKADTGGTRMARKKWSDLSTGQKRGIALSGAVQIGLLIAALTDIHRRPAGEIRGSKWVWTAASFINFAGPISYFAFGRRRVS
jgi:hypothetical protein